MCMPVTVIKTSKQKAEYMSSICTNERFVFCAIVLVLGTVFLACRSSEFIPIIYITEYYCRSILLSCLAMTAGTHILHYTTQYKALNCTVCSVVTYQRIPKSPRIRFFCTVTASCPPCWSWL